MKGIKLFLLSVIFLIGCDQEKPPAGIIGEQKMVRVLADLHIMDGYISTLSYSDTVRITGKNYYATIYKKHNINKAAFEKSLKYYTRQPALLDSMYSQVEIILLKQEVKLIKIQQDNLKKPQVKQ